MIYSIDYFNMYLIVRNSLHINNVEKISKDELEHISRMYDPNLFEHYKKMTFLKWVYKNSENKSSFLRRAQKVLKKLDVELTDVEMKELSNIEPREFTELRAFKTIEVPYKDIEDTILLQKDAFFFYKGIKTFRRRKIFFEKVFEGEIYITKKEVVLYDRSNHKIQLVISQNEINGVTLKNEYIKLSRFDKESIYFRYKDNELIYISLRRSIVIRDGEGYADQNRDDFLTTEKTLETLLNIQTKEIKKPSKNKKSK